MHFDKQDCSFKYLHIVFKGPGGKFMLLPCRVIECFKQEQQKCAGSFVKYSGWINSMYIGLQETLQDVRRLPLSEQASLHAMLLSAAMCAFVQTAVHAMQSSCDFCTNVALQSKHPSSFVVSYTTVSTVVCLQQENYVANFFRVFFGLRPSV